ncbi:hypothetical protein TcWFU_008968 [Taenia crassiceps]|uniref:Uncharacterized protein n=1 Tax=Taenia crassiceps TaxID=6207 RepID=A0ABR4Q599_9CEST
MRCLRLSPLVDASSPRSNGVGRKRSKPNYSKWNSGTNWSHKDRRIHSNCKQTLEGGSGAKDPNQRACVKLNHLTLVTISYGRVAVELKQQLSVVDAPSRKWPHRDCPPLPVCSRMTAAALLILFF